ncbi:uncharacterized protein [Lepeophtheirus salmonis]|uniref:uncharacterized protein n=1 Tax=Lepeophtheirus salmonis TaxID=72036 RepID=UPI001AE43F9C|nr:uncharacterized protein LOC121118758 isoform X1 [Lepeophtheirus salmonis]
MGGCSVHGCMSRTGSKYKKIHGNIQFFRFPFPKNPTELARRRQWLGNLKFPSGWKPAPTSMICEKHFEANMFYPKSSLMGKNFLKGNAIPTINVLSPPDHTYSKNCQSIEVKLDLSTSNSEDQVTGGVPMELLSPQHISSTLHSIPFDFHIQEVEVQSTCHDCHYYSKKIEHLNSVISSMKKTIETMSKQISVLEDESISKHTFFNSDLLNNLKVKNSKNRSFTNESIKDALKLRMTCGKSGYELLREYLPLPCTRTLQKRTEYFMFNVEGQNTKNSPSRSQKMIDPQIMCTMSLPYKKTPYNPSRKIQVRQKRKSQLNLLVRFNRSKISNKTYNLFAKKFFSEMKSQIHSARKRMNLTDKKQVCKTN